MNDVPVQPGDMLAGGKYRVERVLGRGAMGVVVAARQVALDRSVALKFMTPKGQDIEGYADRFHREALAAAKLQSQHAARVLDFGTLESSAPYIAMEYLEGRDIAATIKDRGPFDVEQAVSLILQACEALAEAHAQGIVHRDIKPANLFLTKAPDGSPCLKLVDFGIAKVKRADLSLTGSAAVLGSPLYMSPEALNGARDLDGRTDIWALGICLYEMLAGVSPFQRDTVAALMAAICMQPPPPLTDYRPDVPAGLCAVIEQALEKDRDRRFQTVAALAAAMAPYAPGRPASYVERVARVQRVDVVPSRPTDLLPPDPSAGPPPVPQVGLTSVPAATQRGPESTSAGVTAPTIPRGVPMPVAFALVAGAVALSAALALAFVRDVRDPAGRAAGSAAPIATAPSAPASPVVVPATSAAQHDPGVTPTSDAAQRPASSATVGPVAAPSAKPFTSAAPRNRTVSHLSPAPPRSLPAAAEVPGGSRQ